MLKRIYLLLVTVVVIAVAITGLIAFNVISQYNDEATHRYLSALSQTASDRISEGESIEVAAGKVLSAFAYKREAFRITVVDRSGMVLFDSVTDPDEMDNHLFRPEIAAAFRTKATGEAVRASDTIKEDMLYLAVYEPVTDLVIRSSMPVNAHQAGVYQLFASTAVVLALVIVIMISIGTILLRRFTRPLIRLRAAADSMRQGNMSARFRFEHGEESTSEMSVLSDAFNEMAERVQTNMKELAEKNDRLDAILDAMIEPVIAVGDHCTVTFMNAPAKKIFGRSASSELAVYPLVLMTHSQETENLVKKALNSGETVGAEISLDTEYGVRDFQVTASPVGSDQPDGVIITFHDISQIKRAQQMRSEFVANVTHELRTPLTSIRGFIETLRNGAIHNEEVADRFLEIIDIEAERLHQLINDILVLSEIEINKEEWDYESFDLVLLMQEVARLLEDQAAEHHVSLILPEESAALQVKANKNRIKQLLINLTDNAIKYNIDGGQVFLTATRLDNGHISLKVRDTGPGIESEHQDRIFERFYRIDKSRSRALGGTGLGLSIVKHIAQLYHGQATVESSPGEGSTFTVLLDI
ncbi:MAG: PAS domain-containing protein [Clostridiaceae bacterium]|nr:PAS domain-containing protein [Clostridiaceae bacterium]